MSDKKYMIVLNGGGDTQIILANPEAEAWLHSPYPSGSGKEKIPNDVLAGNEDYVELTKIQVSPGSGDNDRAMSAPGPMFYSLITAMEYIKENDIEVTGEYSGYLY